MGKILAFAVALLAGITGAASAFLGVLALKATLPRYFFQELPVAVLLVATAIALVLFAPMVLLLINFCRWSFRSNLAAGALSSGLPGLALLWPPSGASWVAFASDIAYWMSLGAFGAWLFYVTLRRLSPNNSFKPKPLRGSA